MLQHNQVVLPQGTSTIRWQWGTNITCDVGAPVGFKEVSTPRPCCNPTFCCCKDVTQLLVGWKMFPMWHANIYCHNLKQQEKPFSHQDCDNTQARQNPQPIALIFGFTFSIMETSKIQGFPILIGTCFEWFKVGFPFIIVVKSSFSLKVCYSRIFYFNLNSHNPNVWLMPYLRFGQDFRHFDF